MKKLYCISGLGADHRIFGRLSIPGYMLVAVPWIPFRDDDDLPAYALRMAASIPEPNPAILGFSFGGMLTTEIARAGLVSEGVIVSSAKTRTEVGYNSQLLTAISESGIVPASLFNMPNPLVFYLIGANTDEDKQVVGDMMKDADPLFNKWVVNALLTWRNEAVPEKIVHIHGTADKVIVPKNVKADHWIAGGSHIMIWDRADEISKLIAGALEDSLT